MLFVTSYFIMSNIEHPECQHCEARFKSVFCELNRGEVEQMNTAKKCIVFKKGEKIFEEGAYPRGLYCVNNGKIKVCQFLGKERL